MHNEIKLGISSTNHAYFSLYKLLSLRMLSSVSKEKIDLAYLRPIMAFACDTWSVTQGDEEKILIFDRKVSRKILYGPVRNNTY